MEEKYRYEQKLIIMEMCKYQRKIEIRILKGQLEALRRNRREERRRTPVI